MTETQSLPAAKTRTLRSDNPTNNQPSKYMTKSNKQPAASDLSVSAGSVPKCPNCNGRGWVESHLLGGSKVWCGMRKCEARDAEIQSQNTESRHAESND